MKTLNLILAAMFIAFATMSYAGIKPEPQGKKANVVKITLLEASHCINLCNSIRAQVDPGQLFSNTHMYTAVVNCHGVVYWVTGTRAQWVRFLKFGINPVPSAKALPMGRQ